MTDLFFILSKVLWAIVQPDHFLLLLLIIGLLLWKRALGVMLVWGYVLIMLVITAYPVGNWLLEPLEQRFPQIKLTEIEEPLAGIIVLGGGEAPEISATYGRPEFGDGAERVMDVPALMLRHPDIPVIFTGGSSSLVRPDFRGGDVAKQWFDEQGLGSRLIIERDSRNTHENALYTRELINEMEDLKPGRWLLITSAFHMPRSVGIYRAAGIDVLPYPVDYKVKELRFNPNLNGHMKELNTAVREWIGIVVYHYTGKTAELFPSVDTPVIPQSEAP